MKKQENLTLVKGNTIPKTTKSNIIFPRSKHAIHHYYLFNHHRIDNHSP